RSGRLRRRRLVRAWPPALPVGLARHRRFQALRVLQVAQPVRAPPRPVPGSVLLRRGCLVDLLSPVAWACLTASPPPATANVPAWTLRVASTASHPQTTVRPAQRQLSVRWPSKPSSLPTR